MMIICFCLVQIQVVAQTEKIDVSVLDSLYVIALNNRIDNLLSSGYKYIEPSEQTERIKNMQVSDRYKFLTSNELTKLSLQEKRTLSLIRIGHKFISKDTIDINLGNAGYTATKKKHADGTTYTYIDIALSCGGTRGYQPSMRFVYDKTKKEWVLTFNSSTEVFKE